MISFLQKYLTINTSQPNPDYKAACALLRVQAESDGFVYNEILLPSGKPVIVITCEGTEPSLPSLILNHHMDVVPALNSEKWTLPPFAGAIDNEIIIGRGVQDMKGVGVAHYYALKELKDAGIQLERTVHIVAVPDEEIGGFTGTKQFTVTGSLAHGSQLNCFNAIHELVSILHKITIHHHAQQQKSATHPDGLLLSMNITSLTAGNPTCFNVVPDCASATVDIRVPPTMLMHQAITLIEDILQHHTNSEYTVHASVPDQPTQNCYKTFLYNSIENTVKQYGLASQPLFFEGSSDLRYYKALNIDGVGFTPFTVANAIHCTNESLPIADLIQGKNIMVNFLKNFCITKENTNG